MNQQGLRVYNYAVSQFKEVSNRELLLRNIREGYSGDHVLRECWGGGGALGTMRRTRRGEGEAEPKNVGADPEWPTDQA